MTRIVTVWRKSPNGLLLSRDNPPLDDFIIGATLPTSSNTGYSAFGADLSSLTVVTTDQNLHESDVPVSRIIANKYYKCFVTTNFTAPVTFQNCYFEGPVWCDINDKTSSPPAGSLVGCNGTAAPVNFDFCTFRAIRPRFHMAAAGGSALGRLYRCDISRGDDLITYVGHPTQTPWIDVQANYFHELSFWDNDPARATDPSWPYATHNDCIQTAGSLNAKIIGNNFEAYADLSSGMPNTLATRRPALQTNSVLMATLSHGRHENMLIKDNWTRGAAAQIQNPYQSNAYNTGNSWEVTGNRFGCSTEARGPYGSSPPKYSYQITTYGTTGNNMGHDPSDTHDNIWNPLDPVTPDALKGTPCDPYQETLGLTYRIATKIPGT